VRPEVKRTKYRQSLFGSTLKGVFFFCAALSVASVLFISAFILKEGLPLFFVSESPVGPPAVTEFLFGTEWSPTDKPPLFGILPFIAATFMVTVGALLVAVPMGVAVGIFIAEIADGRARSILTGATEILAGIPSVVFGFAGVMTIGFFLRIHPDPLINYNAFSASLILALMTLPTIVSITTVSLRAVPNFLGEASLALGATQWQTIWRVLLPAARSGILTGIILGMGRAVGETMAVIMVAGNQPTLPDRGYFSRVRTLTMAVVNDMGYAGGDHRTALFATAIVLFLFIILLNAVTHGIAAKAAKGGHQRV